MEAGRLAEGNYVETADGRILRVNKAETDLKQHRENGVDIEQNLCCFLHFRRIITFQIDKHFIVCYSHHVVQHIYKWR